MKDIPGRMTQFSLSNVNIQVLGADPNRTRILFLPPIANRVTYVPNPLVAVDGLGIALSATSQWIDVYGDLAQHEWWAILNVAGPNTISLLEFFTPGD